MIHDGHRERLRKKFCQGALEDHELLELLLFYSIPRCNTNETAHELLLRFGSLDAVMRYSSVEMDRALFSDLMDTRLLIESECARLACRNIYESTLEKMQLMVDKLAAEPEDPTEILYRFHYRLVQASGNTIYGMIYRGFETVLQNLIRQHYSMRAEDIRESARLHQELLDAIRAADESAAEQKARQILTQGITALEERYAR